MANLRFPGLHSSPEQLIAAAQDLTDAWVDLGAQLHVAGAVAIALYLTIDINDSTDVRVRALASHTEGGDEYVLPIQTVAATVVTIEPEYMEFAQDADQLIVVPFDLDGLVPWIQFQVMAAVVGVAAGQIDTAHAITSGRE